MPLDFRRLPVPEDSKPPFVYIKSSAATNGVKLLTDTDGRFDGRLFSQHRPIFANVGVVSKARGSAYVELGSTKVICSIFGPREVKFRDEFSLLGQLTCDVKFATFSGAVRRQHQQDADEKEASVVVREALLPAVRLDKFPKAKVEVFVIVLEDDGSALSAAISCASLALADGGIEMFDLAVGISVRRVHDVTLIDPDKREEQNIEEPESVAAHGKLTIALLPSLNQISNIVFSGLQDVQTLQQCQRSAVEACHQVYAVVRQCLLAAADRRLNLTQTSTTHGHTTSTCISESPAAIPV